MPTWSPTGAKLSYVLRRSDLDYVPYVIDADGRNKRRLAAHVPGPTPATWSPDGARIAVGTGRLPMGFGDG